MIEVYIYNFEILKPVVLEKKKNRKQNREKNRLPSIQTTST